MSERSSVRALSFLLCSAALFLPPAGQKTALSPAHGRWLKEEVVYIIGDKEKSVFLALESERDRDLFVEEFWKQRDPTPGTPRNEFRDEHYRRIEFANQTFGRGTHISGVLSEVMTSTHQGRLYFIDDADGLRLSILESPPAGNAREAVLDLRSLSVRGGIRLKF
jgi:GWxTD domain-containing protein